MPQEPLSPGTTESPTPPTSTSSFGRREKRPISAVQAVSLARRKMSLDRVKQSGPAPKPHKRLKRAVEHLGLTPKQLPELLQDKVVAATPGRDPLGRVEIKRYTGVTASPAVEILRRFKETAGSFADIVEKLEASEKLGEAERKLIELLENAPKKALPRMVAQAGVRPSRLLKLYAEGAIALGKVSAAIEVAHNQPMIVKDLLRNALDQEGVCRICVGTGKVKKQRNSRYEDAVCPGCDGSGKRLIASKNKKFSMQRILEIAQLTPEKKGGGGAIVNVSQQVAVVPQQGLFSRVLKSTDEILYNQRFRTLAPVSEGAVAEEVVDAVPTEPSGAVDEPAEA